MTWQPRLGSPTGRVEGVEELAQSLSMLLTTPRGSRPYEPEWGSDLWRLVDEPLDVVRARAPGEVRRAAAFERRVEVVDTVIEPSEQGGFVLAVHWRPAGGSAPVQVTRVRP